MPVGSGLSQGLFGTAGSQGFTGKNNPEGLSSVQTQSLFGSPALGPDTSASLSGGAAAPRFAVAPGSTVGPGLQTYSGASTPTATVTQQPSIFGAYPSSTGVPGVPGILGLGASPQISRPLKLPEDPRKQTTVAPQST